MRPADIVIGETITLERGELHWFAVFDPESYYGQHLDKLLGTNRLALPWPNATGYFDVARDVLKRFPRAAVRPADVTDAVSFTKAHPVDVYSFIGGQVRRG